jgi:hypothetical protein
MARSARISARMLRNRNVVRSGFSVAMVLALALAGVIGFLCMVGPQRIGLSSDKFTGLRVSDSRLIDHSKSARPVNRE